jgi:hypothetical protein
MAFNADIAKLGVGQVPQIVERIRPLEQSNKGETQEERGAAGQQERRKDVRA